MRGEQDELLTFFIEAVRTIEIRNFPFPVRLRAERAGMCQVVLVVEADVRDRNIGLSMTINFKTSFPAHIIYPSVAYVTDVVHRALKGFLIHELDEALHVDGVRVFDPHAREKRP